MKILDAGHKYAVQNVNNSLHAQCIQFVKRSGENFPFNEGHYDGTNVQEILRVLIDRSEYLNNQKPCAETEAAIGCLRSALVLFELRAARRHGRHVDATTTQHFMCSPVCDSCKHVGCNGKCRK